MGPMSDTNRPGRWRDESGFSLLELLVASAMAVLVVGGMLLIFDSVRDVHRDQSQLIDAQMTARIALEQMQRDIQLAGIGLLGLMSPLPVIEPRPDGGIDVRYNSDNLTARLSANMSGPSAQLVVDDATGFQAGMQVVVYDGTGAFDLVTLSGVSGNSLAHVSTLTKAYQVVDGAAVKRIETISYRLQSVNGVFWLQRQLNNDTPQPVALNVRSMTITYFDDASPPVAFTPVTLVDQLRVNVIEVTLVVETEEPPINETAERTVTLTARITPRSVMLMS